MRIVPHILGAAIAAALFSTPVFAAELTGTLKKIKESGVITPVSYTHLTLPTICSV